MLSDCDYTKIRLLHDLSRIQWYIEKHAKGDAIKEQHDECNKIYEDIQKDLEKHIEKLKEVIF